MGPAESQMIPAETQVHSTGRQVRPAVAQVCVTGRVRFTLAILSCPPLEVVRGRKAFLKAMHFCFVYLRCPHYKLLWEGMHF